MTRSSTIKSGINVPMGQNIPSRKDKGVSLSSYSNRIRATGPRRTHAWITLPQPNSNKYITSVLRTGKTPTAPEIISVLKRIVRRIRATWPQVRIIFRADSHHTKPEVMEWLNANGVDFITDLSASFVLSFVEKHDESWMRTDKACDKARDKG
jgi:hypothetical protein